MRARAVGQFADAAIIVPVAGMAPLAMAFSEALGAWV
jgi:hypothetical protein